MTQQTTSTNKPPSQSTNHATECQRCDCRSLQSTRRQFMGAMTGAPIVGMASHANSRSGELSTGPANVGFESIRSITEQSNMQEWNTLTIDGGTADYKLTVSGDLKKSDANDASVNTHDVIEGSTAQGHVRNGRDSYQFTGEILSLSVNGTATVHLNGQKIDPTDFEVTAEEALEKKKTAEERLEELKSLNKEDEVNIDKELLTSIEQRLERGHVAMQSEEYAEAISHYISAIEQAEAGLIDGYKSRADLLLAASESNLQKRKDAGYTDPEVNVLEERISEARDELAAADDLSAARDVHERSVKIYGAVNKLPSPWVTRISNFIASPLSVIGGLVAGVVGVAVWFYQKSPDKEEENTGPKLT